jgi:hypothetical protein
MGFKDLISFSNKASAFQQLERFNYALNVGRRRLTLILVISLIFSSKRVLAEEWFVL